LCVGTIRAILNNVAKAVIDVRNPRSANLPRSSTYLLNLIANRVDRFFNDIRIKGTLVSDARFLRDRQLSSNKNGCIICNWGAV
jgi:hypothetical protein